MIQLHVITKNAKKVGEISSFLIKEKLITSAIIIDAIAYSENNLGELETVNEKLIIGKTKATLFGTIDNLLNTHFKGDIAQIYAMPIVGMALN